MTKQVQYKGRTITIQHYDTDIFGMGLDPHWSFEIEPSRNAPGSSSISEDDAIEQAKAAIDSDTNTYDQR
jgi:hypothetical protein